MPFVTDSVQTPNARSTWYGREPSSRPAGYLGWVPFTPAVPDGQHDYLRGVHPIDDAVGMLEDLSIRRLPDLGNDSAALRQSTERRDPI